MAATGVIAALKQRKKRKKRKEEQEKATRKSASSEMYEYKFVKVDLKGVFTRKPKEDHHRLVEEYAEKGWRLVQIFSPAVSATGGGIPDYFELIFEKKK